MRSGGISATGYFTFVGGISAFDLFESSYASVAKRDTHASIDALKVPREIAIRHNTNNNKRARMGEFR
jgi:hypothetical protein